MRCKMIVNNKPKSLDASPVPSDISAEVIAPISSAEYVALEEENKLLKAENEKLRNAIEEQKAVFKDKLIEVYEQRDKKEEQKSPLEIKMQNCIDFINKTKKRKIL